MPLRSKALAEDCQWHQCLAIKRLGGSLALPNAPGIAVDSAFSVISADKFKGLIYCFRKDEPTPTHGGVCMTTDTLVPSVDSADTGLLAGDAAPSSADISGDPAIVIVQKEPLAPVGASSAAAPIDAGDDAAAAAAAPPLPAVDPLPRAKSTRIIALINQKGGVGKTTSTVNLGAALAALGYRVLLIDLDPQAHLTLHLGIDPAGLQRSNYDLLTDDDIAAVDVMQRVNDNLFVLPAEVNLAGAEMELAPKLVTGRAQRVLKDKLAGLLRGQGFGVQGSGFGPESSEPRASSPQPDARNLNLTAHASTPSSPEPRTPDPEPRSFDYILLDCPPSLGLLTINALTFANEVFVPMQAHFLALQGLSKLLETVGHIRGGFNADLAVTGILLCMHEKQTLLAGEVTADLNAFLESNRGQDVPWRDAIVLTPSIRRNIKLAESPSFGSTIFDYAPDSNGAEDYRKLAMAVVKQGVLLGK